MLGQREARRHESFDGVTAFTAAFISAPRKLARMHVFMTIAAGLMRNFLFEVAARMALLARERAMLAAQRKIRHVMIKNAAANEIPSFGRMTLRTRISKTAAMRILMARRAIRKRQTGVLHKRGDRFIADFFARRFFEMTFRARHEFMPAREHELRALVRKFCRGFPAREVMTTRAIFTKLAAMLIGMTTQTIL